MPKTLYNYDSQTAVLYNESPGVLPGESREFSDEELAAGWAGMDRWSDKDPRRGLADERAWKKERDAQPATGDAEPVADPPAEPVNTEETP